MTCAASNRLRTFCSCKQRVDLIVNFVGDHVEFGFFGERRVFGQFDFRLEPKTCEYRLPDSQREFGTVVAA